MQLDFELTDLLVELGFFLFLLFVLFDALVGKGGGQALQELAFPLHEIDKAILAWFSYQRMVEKVLEVAKVQFMTKDSDSIEEKYTIIAMANRDCACTVVMSQ